MASKKSNSKVSSSEALRREGNEIYRLVSRGSYGPCILRDKLERAHQLYKDALDAAEPCNPNERSSCYKNLALLNWLWGKAEWNIYMKAKGKDEALTAIRAAKQHISKAVVFHIRALELGLRGNKPSKWLKEEEDSLTNIIEWVKEHPMLVELCTTIMHKVDEQQRKVEKEKEEYNRKHEEDSKELQESIEGIKREGEKSAESFLLFIYKEHNHRDLKKRVMGNIETKESVKGALKKAIMAYHPDQNGKHGRDWQFLCVEISKILNLKYGNFK